jgi:hypothetical protein
MCVFALSLFSYKQDGTSKRQGFSCEEVLLFFKQAWWPSTALSVSFQDVREKAAQMFSFDRLFLDKSGEICYCGGELTAEA